MTGEPKQVQVLTSQVNPKLELHKLLSASQTGLGSLLSKSPSQASPKLPPGLVPQFGLLGGQDWQVQEVGEQANPA
jgi:hypothetical protein